MNNIYQEIGQRTGGNIYIGVVGPVRTGKSTLVKRFIENLVLPHIDDPYLSERTKDELPQCGSGRTIMTSEPKFVPEEAIELPAENGLKVRIRLIDSVGYMVPGAVGAEEDGSPRMVTTPWFDHEIPMSQAAHLGTQKVMQEHCSVGIVVTTDGSISDIPRNDYEEAEDRAILDMKATGKPFLVVINSARPDSSEAEKVKSHIREKYHLEPVVADCQSLDEEEIRQLLHQLLYTFPMRRLLVHFPRWLDALEENHPLKPHYTNHCWKPLPKSPLLGKAVQLWSSCAVTNLCQTPAYQPSIWAPGTSVVGCIFRINCTIKFSVTRPV